MVAQLIYTLIGVALLAHRLGGFKAFDVAYVITLGGPGFATNFSTFQIFRTALDGAL